MVVKEQIQHDAHPTTVPSRGRIRPAEMIQGREIQLGLLVVAAALLIGSMFLPYWQLTLHAPQYPKGLHITAYVDRLEGDIREVDGLNHYIGMMKLEDAARLERAVSRFALPAIAALAVASYWVRGRLRWLLVLPILIYPIVFVADLAAWLYYAGHSLDPHAALSTSIKPFTPRVLGEGRIGQFWTEAWLSTGFLFAVLAALLSLAATMLGRKGARAPR